MIYRALKDLDAGKTRIERGQVFAAGKLSQAAIDRLVELGRIAPVSTPPLAVLPGWKTRAEMLAASATGPEVETVGQYLEAPAEVLAERMKVSVERAEQWKLDLVGWLSIPKPKG